jgi:hypothetical protein
VLALAGLVAAFAIGRLPGHGGHSPAGGLATGRTRPIELPGVLLAAAATIGLGVVLGPEAPLIALGSGLGMLAVDLSGTMRPTSCAPWSPPPAASRPSPSSSAHRWSARSS